VASRRPFAGELMPQWGRRFMDLARRPNGRRARSKANRCDMTFLVLNGAGHAPFRDTEAVVAWNCFT
jgi:hypothetical protein